MNRRYLFLALPSLFAASLASIFERTQARISLSTQPTQRGPKVTGLGKPPSATYLYTVERASPVKSMTSFKRMILMLAVILLPQNSEMPLASTKPPHVSLALFSSLQPYCQLESRGLTNPERFIYSITAESNPTNQG